MKIFNPRHFLRHISMPTLHEFAAAHVLNSRLDIDWQQAAETLPMRLADAVDALNASLQDPELPALERKAIEFDLHLWHDDLRRAHMMSNALAIKGFRMACDGDADIEPAFALRNDQEKALWMMAFRDKAFRDAELHLAFQAKTNGKYWKKHRIQAGLNPTRDRDKLETFCHEVARLYKKVGAGDGTHIEISERTGDGSIQLALYVEGPVTAIAHFAENHFKRITTRIALETALVYHPDSGMVETVVKGGAANHTAVLQLFGKHVVQREIAPEAIGRAHFRLNALRDGLMEPFDDWSAHGIEKARLRRARFSPTGSSGISFEVEAPADKEQDDAIQLALDNLKIQHSFEAEYNLIRACIIVYPLISAERKSTHFSFDVSSTGSSTIRNLSVQNQHIAHIVLQALNVIEPEEVPA
jgi:hypothetical protein